MTETPAISVVLPTYNHLRFLPAAIEDIVRQTRTDWELLVVDDGSADGTAAWLAATALDARIRVIGQDNRGPDAAINTGILAARGQYLTWVSADNRCAPYFLEALGAALDGDPRAEIAYSPYYAIDENDRVRACKFDNLLLLRELVTGTPRGMAGFLYHRALHDAVGLYEGFACDTRMWARIAERNSGVFVLEPTYYYRFHDDRASVRQGFRIEQERVAIIRDFLRRHADLPAEALLRLLYPGLARAPHCMADAAADAATRFMRAGIAAAAWMVAREGLLAAPEGGLLGPLAVAVTAARGVGLDPIKAILPLLDATHLCEATRDAGVTTLVALGQGGGAMPALLPEGHELRRLEQPKIFSYTAWKSGFRAPPLPAF